MTDWTEQEREAADPWEVFVDTDGYNSIRGRSADAILDALAPFVAGRERVAAARALRDVAAAWQEGGWADDLPPEGRSRPQLILGMAQRAVAYFRARADQIERPTDD